VAALLLLVVAVTPPVMDWDGPRRPPPSLSRDRDTVGGGRSTPHQTKPDPTPSFRCARAGPRPSPSPSLWGLFGKRWKRIE
jgi:hypothetical protein